MTIYPTFLYIKRHSITGLKYFGKTTGDPYTYNGSGKHWLNHIKKYGKEYIETLWISEPYTDSELISDQAILFSKHNNIVESKDWANLKEENGLDGSTKGTSHSEETKAKVSASNKGKTRSAEARAKMSAAKMGKLRKPFSEETKQKMSNKLISEETRAKISASGKGRTHSEESKRKMSDARKGESLTEEHKHKISQALLSKNSS
jgi:hypothetical protein